MAPDATEDMTLGISPMCSPKFVVPCTNNLVAFTQNINCFYFYSLLAPSSEGMHHRYLISYSRLVFPFHDNSVSLKNLLEKAISKIYSNWTWLLEDRYKKDHVAGAVVNLWIGQLTNDIYYVLTLTYGNQDFGPSNIRARRWFDIYWVLSVPTVIPRTRRFRDCLYKSAFV